MNSEINNILREYTAGEKTLEETNQALTEAGAAYHFEPLTDEERAAKNAREDAVGYYPGTPRKKIPERPDMKRRPDLAGRPKWERETVQHTLSGDYRVEYDGQGYAVRAVKVGEPT